MTQPITVVSESIPQNNHVEMIINQQSRHVAFDGPDASVADLLNAILAENGGGAAVATKDANGNLVLGEQVFILRNGASMPPTVNGDTRVMPGDRVVYSKKHSNGAVTVVKEEIAPEQNQIEVIFNQQAKYVAIDGPDATVEDLLNGIFSQQGSRSVAVTKQADGSLKMGDQVFVLRGGSALPPTYDANFRVVPGDRVVYSKKHSNG